MTTMTGPRPMTDAEKEAWTLHLQKVPVASIQQKTGLLPSQIAAAVDLGQVHARRAMESSTAVLPAPPPKVTAPKAPAPKPVDAEGYLTVTKLLTWAEQSGHTRALTLASRIRTSIDELRAFHAQHDARAKAQAEVDRLTAELEAAKAALKQAGGGQPRTVRPAGAKPDEGRREQLAAIRTWAAAAGFEISPLGRIPQGVVAAYNAAHETPRSDA